MSFCASLLLLVFQMVSVPFLHTLYSMCSPVYVSVDSYFICLINKTLPIPYPLYLNYCCYAML